nr:mechanosensitive ion channel family protein [Acidobacteriota bacterium]
KKLLLSIAFIAVVWLIAWLLGRVASFFTGDRWRKLAFWFRQGVHLLSAALVLVGLCSVWFDNPARLTTAFGLVTAGLAFALQRVITAFAAYIVILRGSTFSVGDRIVMGGVRGDVIELGFIQTTIMEMGQPPSVQSADPAMWVQARQYTGRIVTLTNDKLFDMPVYNYTREFPFLWEEIMIPIPYQTDLKKAERILLDAVTRNTVKIAEIGEESLVELERRYIIKRSDLGPRAFIRLTDNWIEITARFIVRDHGIRELKDAISREVLNALNEAGMTVASGTYQIVGMPPISVHLKDSSE